MIHGSVEICAVMVLSIEHIDEKTLKELDRWEKNYSDWDGDHWISHLNAGPVTYGYFIRARPDSLKDEAPKCIKDAVTYAHERGIAWLHYDVDADTVPDLEVYDHG